MNNHYKDSHKQRNLKMIAITHWIVINLQKDVMKNEFLVSKETVVLCWWERSKQKFGFIKRVDKG